MERFVAFIVAVLKYTSEAAVVYYLAVTAREKHPTFRYRCAIEFLGFSNESPHFVEQSFLALEPNFQTPTLEFDRDTTVELKGLKTLKRLFFHPNDHFSKTILVIVLVISPSGLLISI